MKDTARRLGIARSTLYDRCRADPEVEAVRVEERETFIDLAESELHKLVASGNAQAIIFCLRTLGHARGWREGLRIEQKDERPKPYRNPEAVTAALRTLSPDEIADLERVLTKFENAANVATREAEFAADGNAVTIARTTTSPEGGR